MLSSFTTSRVVFLLLGLSATAEYRLSAQSTPAAPAQAQPTTPKGKVLFERHEPPVTDTPEVPAAAGETVPENTMSGTSGISSSNKRSRTTLRRRNQPATDAADQPDHTSQPTAPSLDGKIEGSSPAESSSNDGGESTLPDGRITLTRADVEAARQVTLAQRLAVTITGQDLDLHLDAHTGAAEVRAQVRVRNTGPDPLQQVPLRISGALHWESGRLAGSPAPLPLQQHRLADDLDHTGFATELLIPLPEPLKPGDEVSLDLYYGGPLTASTQRLTALGAPEGRAALTDWDTVTDTFTGLRGMGSVLWYPVAGAPALLRDGSAVTDAVESSRAANAGSPFRLRLTLEYAGWRPDAAFFCGERQTLVPLAADGQPGGDQGFVTAAWTREALGFHTPSLFIADGAPQEAASGLVRVATNRADTSAATGEAAARVRPMLQDWLGAAPQRSLDVLDLPIPGATGFADGSLLVAPLTTAPAGVLAPSLVQPLASAWLPAGIAAPWLREGLPAFLQAVWAERTAGRTSALAALEASWKHAHVEPGAPGFSSSQPVETAQPSAAPLATCNDAPCARNKGAYVFEMLRNMLGDSGLQQAISGWAVQQGQMPGRSAAEETAAMKELLQRIAGKKDLSWFFANWIDADRGLPDLRIVLVAPRRAERSTPVISLPQARRPVAGPIGAEPVAPTDPRDMNERDAQALAAANGGEAGPAPGSWLVAVEVQNNGSADAEVPVTVRSGGLTNTLPLHIAAHSRATVRVPFEADPAEVLVNDGSVPEVTTATHRKSVGSLPAAR